MAAASSSSWKRSPPMESTPSPLQQVTEKFGKTSLSNGGGGAKDQINGRRFSASPIPSPSPSPDDIVRHGQHVRGGGGLIRSPAESDGTAGGGSSGPSDGDKTGSGNANLTREQREMIRFSMVKRKKDFSHMEKVGRRMVNIMEGLELHTGVFSAAEQKRIVDRVYDFQEKGRKGQLRECSIMGKIPLHNQLYREITAAHSIIYHLFPSRRSFFRNKYQATTQPAGSTYHSAPPYFMSTPVGIASQSRTVASQRHQFPLLDGNSEEPSEPEIRIASNNAASDLGLDPIAQPALSGNSSRSFYYLPSLSSST